MLHHFEKHHIGFTRIISCSIFCIILLAGAVVVQSQEKDHNLSLNPGLQQKAGGDTIPPYPIVDMKWLKTDRDIQYTDGVVIASFYVEPDGIMSDIKITKSINKETDAYAVRKLKEIKRWEPAKYKGKPVRYLMHYPFTFENSGNVTNNISKIEILDDKNPELSGSQFMLADDKNTKTSIKSESDDNEETFTVVEKMPTFPGGDEARNAYLSQNITYPKSALDKKIEGTVFISFLVRKDGSISDVRILRGVSEDIDKESLRVVTGMPKWNPGVQRGKPVDVQFNMPIKFALKKTKKK